MRFFFMEYKWIEIEQLKPAAVDYLNTRVKTLGVAELGNEVAILFSFINFIKDKQGRAENDD